MKRRPDPSLVVIEGLCLLGGAVARVTRGRECVLCFERHRNMPAHVYVDHGDEGGI